MTLDPTLPQNAPERRRSQEMSLERASPPLAVPGYDAERLLGVGAYGEVWVAIERNTGRRVAIKFYSHRRGLDWSLLSREVEKLAFLFADRYVVQLIGVGWESDPPYYVMEYLEQGSLADRLQQGPLGVQEAVDLAREVAIGLVHAHDKGVLHCDLKPANILLDRDCKPRLADFGQSRLSHEQTPALGTLFYMAPEQADLKAVPDARWDVYSLGALIYCMLTGSPPYRTAEAVDQIEQFDSLEQRLAQYRRLIRQSPRPVEHRQVRGIDRALAEIIDRCLEIEPRKRYPNVQAVLSALDARAVQRAMRPLKVLGAVGPALVLLVVSLFAWRGFSTAISHSAEALAERALESNGFAAQSVARSAAYELERRYEAVERVAGSKEFQEAAAEFVSQPDMRRLLAELSDPGRPDAELAPLREEFRSGNADRQRLQDLFDRLLPPALRPPLVARDEDGEAAAVASWFFVDANGISTVRVPQSGTIGRNYAWRSFFHGGDSDLARDWRPQAGKHVTETRPSAVFRSQASNRWIVAISTPVQREIGGRKEFLGVVALTVEVGKFARLESRDDQFAVLVDARRGEHQGVILSHPLFEKYKDAKLPDHFVNYRVTPAHLQAIDYYRDPLAAAPEGADYRKLWLARREPVNVRGEDIGWWIIVQQGYDRAIGQTLNSLRRQLVLFGLAALVMVLVVVIGLWGLAMRLLRESGPGRFLATAAGDNGSQPTPRPSGNAPTEFHGAEPRGP